MLRRLDGPNFDAWARQHECSVTKGLTVLPRRLKTLKFYLVQGSQRSVRAPNQSYGRLRSCESWWLSTKTELWQAVTHVAHFPFKLPYAMMYDVFGISGGKTWKRPVMGAVLFASWEPPPPAWRSGNSDETWSDVRVLALEAAKRKAMAQSDDIWKNMQCFSCCLTIKSMVKVVVERGMIWLRGWCLSLFGAWGQASAVHEPQIAGYRVREDQCQCQWILQTPRD